MKIEIPIWEKYIITVEEAAVYVHIGENKLRRILEENKNAKYILYNGNRVLIKRRLFEEFVDELQVI